MPAAGLTGGTGGAAGAAPGTPVDMGFKRLAQGVDGAGLITSDYTGAPGEVYEPDYVQKLYQTSRTLFLKIGYAWQL